MNDVKLARLLELVRCIPRQQLAAAEELFRFDRKQGQILERLAELERAHSCFRHLAVELRGRESFSDDVILAIRTAILTRSRTAVHSPKAVCTSPEPCVPGMEDTLTESLRLIESAEHSISMMNYWMTGGSEPLVSALMRKTGEKRGLRMVLIGDSKEHFLDPLNRLWRKNIRRPTIYIYQPGMAPESDDRSKMHAKTLVVDESRMLITSANLTRSAMESNIEMGVSIEAPRAVRKVAQFMNELIHMPELFQRVP